MLQIQASAGDAFASRYLEQMAHSPTLNAVKCRRKRAGGMP